MTEKLPHSLNSRTLICYIKCRRLSQQMTGCTNRQISAWKISKRKPGALPRPGKRTAGSWLEVLLVWISALRLLNKSQLTDFCKFERNVSSEKNEANSSSTTDWISVMWSTLSNVCLRQQPLMTPRSNEVIIIEFSMMIWHSFHFKLINQFEVSPSNWICCYRTWLRLPWRREAFAAGVPSLRDFCINEVAGQSY